ncbi:MAG: hypothetical protein ACYCO3_04085 [Mycobacteriales bacterium]
MRLALLVLVTAVVAALIAVPVALLARRRARRGGAPSAIQTELLARLSDEVREWRAEAEHWQRTALRLQAELDAGRKGTQREVPPE